MAKTKPQNSTASRGASAAPPLHQRTGNRVGKNRNPKKNALRNKLRKEKRKLQAKEAKAKTDEQNTETNGTNGVKDMKNTTKTHSNNEQASIMQKTKFEKKAAKRAAKKAAKEVQKAQADMESFLPGFLFGDSLVMVETDPQLDAKTITVSIDAYQAEIERLRALKAMLSKEEEDATASST